MARDTQLDTLEAKGLIRLAAVKPELEYLFRHALVQNAAYGSLLKQERRELHGRVGAALEELYPERLSELAAVLAMHYEQAGETDKAIGYLVAAGRYSLQRNAVQEAYSAFDRAAELLPPPGPGDDSPTVRRRVDVALGRANAGYSFRPPETTITELEAIAPEAAGLGDRELEAQVHLLSALARLLNGEDPTGEPVRRSLDRITEIGHAVGDPSLRAMPLALVGINNVFAGSVRDGVRQLEEAVPLLDRRQDSIGAAFARGALAIGLATLGEFAAAEAAAARASEIAEKGDLIAKLDALIAESMVRSIRGDLEGAVPLARQCVERAEETGATACAVTSAWILGDAYHRQGRLEDAREILRRGHEISMTVERKIWWPTLHAWWSTTAAALGERAGGDWDAALEMARSIGHTLGEAGILWKRAEAAVGRGELEAALRDFAECAAIYDREGARPDLARVLRAWGEALRAAGRQDDAESRLRGALAMFEELELEREAAEVRAALSVGGTKIEFS